MSNENGMGAAVIGLRGLKHALLISGMAATFAMWMRDISNGMSLPLVGWDLTEDGEETGE